jgi:hypothetical protein
MSKQTLEFHWGKHHRAYIDNLKKQIDSTDLERKNLEELVKFSYNNGNPQACFNNAGQVQLPTASFVVKLEVRIFFCYLEFIETFKSMNFEYYCGSFCTTVLVH